MFFTVNGRKPLGFSRGALTFVDCLAPNSSHRFDPAQGIFCLAVLDVHNGIVQLLSHGAHLAVTDADHLVAVFEFSHRGDDRRGAGPEDFRKPPGSVGANAIC